MSSTAVIVLNAILDLSVLGTLAYVCGLPHRRAFAQPALSGLTGSGGTIGP